jgi:hypothetical protein
LVGFAKEAVVVGGVTGPFLGAVDCKFDGTPKPKPMAAKNLEGRLFPKISASVKPESQVGHQVEFISRSVCEKKPYTVGIGSGS